MHVYKIYDTIQKKYVVKNTYGYGTSSIGKKQFWNKPGAAKSACVIMINHIVRARDHYKNIEMQTTFPDLVETHSFKNQSRYEIHEMNVVFGKVV